MVFGVRVHRRGEPSPQIARELRAQVENHADYNAAKNIDLKIFCYKAGNEEGAPSDVRLNSGVVNTNGVASGSELAEWETTLNVTVSRPW